MAPDNVEVVTVAALDKRDSGLRGGKLVFLYVNGKGRSREHVGCNK
jgi:hypothetical protein